MGMLHVFDFDVYVLLDHGANLSFVTPYLVMRSDVTSDVLLEPFFIYTPIGDAVLAKRINRNCLVLALYKLTQCYLTELEMTEFDITLGMD